MGAGLLHAVQITKAAAHCSNTRTADFSAAQALEDQPLESATEDRTTCGEMRVVSPSLREAGGEARRQGLLHRARAEDVLHWPQYQQRPISAETLRNRLHVAAATARGLAVQLRNEIHVALDGLVRPRRRRACVTGLFRADR
ncbi:MULTISPECIES: hypothetical protein [unclassified Pseudofrankia]|uniref:hypothetical protein n=1 Tax=unclassified Pseudofrankia TaxID=2994372 RepID=UPI0008DAD172|nr:MULTISPECIES: hypothetical protein [unclassified Pseudofrankia]MDT3439885.1 hypothetical protein [Pseudofrankia sp. BMG5.37]OHV48361.1 hypothetical protein BCD48_15325 [Pseudofrankia sp. BMG5.36]